MERINWKNHESYEKTLQYQGSTETYPDIKSSLSTKRIINKTYKTINGEPKEASSGRSMSGARRKRSTKKHRAIMNHEKYVSKSCNLLCGEGHR